MTFNYSIMSFFCHRCVTLLRILKISTTYLKSLCNETLKTTRLKWKSDLLSQTSLIYFDKLGYILYDIDNWEGSWKIYQFIIYKGTFSIYENFKKQYHFLVRYNHQIELILNLVIESNKPLSVLISSSSKKKRATWPNWADFHKMTKDYSYGTSCIK